MEKTIVSLPDKVEGVIFREAIFKRLTCDDQTEVIITEFDEVTYTMDGETKVELSRERKSYDRRNADAVVEEGTGVEITPARTEYDAWDAALGDQAVRPSIVVGIKGFYGIVDAPEG